MYLEPYNASHIENELWSVQEVFDVDFYEEPEIKIPVELMLHEYQILVSVEDTKVALDDTIELTMIPVDDYEESITAGDDEYIPPVNELEYNVECASTEVIRKRKVITNSTQKRRHQCPTCEKRFVRPAELLRHMTTHTNTRSFICDQCSSEFKRADHLRSHKKSIHGDKKFHCDCCTYTTARKDTLNRHLRNRHPK